MINLRPISGLGCVALMVAFALALLIWGLHDPPGVCHQGGNANGAGDCPTCGGSGWKP